MVPVNGQTERNLVAFIIHGPGFKKGGTAKHTITAYMCIFLPTTSSLLTIVGFCFLDNLGGRKLDDWTT